MMVGSRIGEWSGKKLPYDAEVEYLGSTGKQWINSGVMSEYPKIHAGLWYDMFRSPYTGLFGNYRSEQHNCVRLILQETDNDKAWVTPGTTAGRSINVPFAKREWHNVYLDCTARSCSIDGQLFTSSYVGTRYVDYIFIFSNNQVQSQGTVIRISFFKIFDENGVLVRDFVPVRVGDVGYLYDRVSGQLFGNIGTGAFVIGRDMVGMKVAGGGYKCIRLSWRSSRRARHFSRWEVAA